ncbi:MAG: enoyl-CoA hydratase-related protein [Pseudomonadota bacterium]
MSQFETISVARDSAVATVTLNRPDAMNSFDTPMRKELGIAMQQLRYDDDVRVVVLTAAGRAFSAGADLKEGFPEGDYRVGEQLQQEYRPSFRAITDMPKPVISAVNGSAAGIGLAYALVADITIMADSAFLLSPFTTISLVGDGGCNWLLARQLGYRKAFELSVLSERITAEQALAYGLVNRVVPADELASSTAELAATLAARAPLSLAATKKVMRFAMTASYDETYDFEARTQTELLFTEDNVEGVSAFLEKRTPQFKGR